MKSPIRLVIADLEEESTATCQSAVSSIVPSEVLFTVLSALEFLNIASTGDDVVTDARDIRVALVACDSLEAETLSSILSRLHENGWLVLVYCDYNAVSQVLAHVCKGDDYFLECASPMFLMVTLPDPQENEEGRSLVDVGLRNQRCILCCTR